MKKTDIPKFSVLNGLIILFKSLGWLVFIGSFIVASQILISPQIIIELGLPELGFGQTTPWLIALGVAIGGTIYAILFWALSELVQWALSVEENLRKFRELLDKK